jgi:transposase
MPHPTHVPSTADSLPITAGITPIALYADIQLDPKPLGHLPLVRAVIEKVGIRSVIDRLLPKDPRARVSDGDCVTLMILNILQGRVALYSMQDWLAATDHDVVLGPNCPPCAFHDARLAACLDHLYAAGTDEVLTSVVTTYLSSPSAPREYSVHGDTTSLKVYGAMNHQHTGRQPLPAYGYSKDHRPDLKQLIFGLSLHGAVGVPLTCNLLDGNTSDHFANRLQIDQLADLLPEEDDVTLVADCKLYDPHTLGQVLLQDFHFVTLVPGNYGLRGELIEEVRTGGVTLAELSRQPGATKADPDRVYSGTSFERRMKVGLPHDTGSNARREVPLRYLVVQSSQLGAKYEAGLDGRLAAAESRFRRRHKQLTKNPFRCREDAEAALKKLSQDNNLALLDASMEVVPEVVTLSRPRRGRPRKGEEAPTKEVFRLVIHSVTRDEQAIEKARFHARHFVLATDHTDPETWPDGRILEEYRHQHMIEGHTGFRWIKGIAEVAPIFLETPRRIAALSLVFVLALMVRNYIQFTLRQRLADAERTVLDRKRRPTQSPTTETALLRFAGVMGLRIEVDGQVARQVHGLTSHCLTVLQMLDVPVDVFTTVRQKIPGTAPPTSGI